MPAMTEGDLVRVVGQLGQSPGRLVTGREIMDWCAAQAPSIDYGAGNKPTNDLFWAADFGEARGQHRLCKFKKGKHQTAPNAWALIENETRSPGLRAGERLVVGPLEPQS